MADIVAPKVFISYAHDSPWHKRDVLELATFLRGEGIDAVLDEWFTDIRQDWYSLVIRLMAEADFVIVVASEKYRQVGDGAGPEDEHRGVQTEAAFLREQVYSMRTTWSRKILPVVLPGHRIDEIPLFLQPRTASHYLVTACTPQGADELLRVVLGQPRHLPPPVTARGLLPLPPAGRPVAAEVRWCEEILGSTTGRETVELHLVPAGDTFSHSAHQMREWRTELTERELRQVPESLGPESAELAAWAHASGGFAIFRSGQRSAWFDRPAEDQLAGELADHLSLLLTDGPLERPGYWAPALGAGPARATVDGPLTGHDLRWRTADLATYLVERLVAAEPARRATVVHNRNTGKVTGTLIQAGDITGGITIIGR